VGAWSLYVVRTDAGELYTGVATDVARRLEEHRGEGPRAAKFLRGRGPLALVFERELGDRSLALRAEACFKRLPRAEKERLVGEAPERDDLVAALGLCDG
jgi:putative endonuclease